MPEYRGYPTAPKNNVLARPILFAMGAPKRHRIPMIPNTRALAAFTRYGSSAPPAPRSFIAFHKPGAMKPTLPITKALNNVDRYHLFGTSSVEVELDVGSDASSIEACLATSWAAIDQN